ncbi:MAG: hypothetical protein KGQ58_05135 [Proteobacteria bacterium]|nr:hypothetical protein [Pseudomonadota bacterium]MDE3208241.1 hypothetical protein [Pseudomonadota bacterium]
MHNDPIFVRLLNLCQEWEKSGCISYERDPLYNALVLQLRTSIESGDFELIRSVLHTFPDKTFSMLNEVVQDLTETEIGQELLDPLPKLRELFAIPVNILIDAPEGTYVLGKPVGPDLMLQSQNIIAEFLGQGSKVILAGAFYNKKDIHSDYPATALKLRRNLSASLKQGYPKMLLPAASPMEVQPFRKKFLRFLVGLSETDFSGRLLKERRFNPEHFNYFRTQLEEELMRIFQRMGPNMLATIGMPNQFHIILNQKIIFPSSTI